VPPLFLAHSDVALGAYLSNLAVMPSYRRRGLARQLLCTAEWLVRYEWALDELFLHVDMNNAAAASLYDSIGYTSLPEFDAICRSPRTSFAVRTGAPVARNRYHRKALNAPLAADGTAPRPRPVGAGVAEPLARASPLGAVLAGQAP